jgi:ribosomal protein S18 acetylase RimI-like enzyme
MMYAPEVMEKELNNGYHFEIVRIDNTPAGYFSWSPYDLPGTAKLHKVYLLKKFHGMNIGSMMIRQAEMRAGAAGFSRLRLNVNKYNERAKKAYIRNHFATVESVKIDIGNGFFMDDFVMEKTI